MKIRKLALILGISAIALCGCGDKTSDKTTGTQEKESEIPSNIDINTERATEMIGETETGQENNYEKIKKGSSTLLSNCYGLFTLCMWR